MLDAWAGPLFGLVFSTWPLAVSPAEEVNPAVLLDDPVYER